MIKMANLIERTLDDYNNAINKFNNYINTINNPLKNNQIHEGYLVNYKNYKEFENYIIESFKEQQNKYDKSQTNKENYLNQNYNINNIIRTKKLKTENLNEVINQILKNNKFIIINENL